jgi:hypothetical protein
MWFPLHRRHVTIFPLEALGASSLGSTSFSLPSYSLSADNLDLAICETYLVGDGDWLEVDILSDDGGLPVESSSLALVLSEPGYQCVFYASWLDDLLGPSLPLGYGVCDQAGLHLSPDSSRSLGVSSTRDLSVYYQLTLMVLPFSSLL